MRFGGMERWQSRMRDVDAAFREAVRSAWAQCRKGLASDGHEDHISAKLVALLRRQRTRTIPYNIVYQPSDPVLDQAGTPYIRGRHDIRVIFALGDDDAALIYECKRLNVVRDGKKSTLATEYVTDGMMRFVTCQYAPRLRQGGMVGYVMNGELADGGGKVRQAILVHAVSLCLEEEPPPAIDDLKADEFTTTHQRLDCASPLRLNHLLLPLSLWQPK